MPKPVLLIEDDPDVLMLTEMALRIHGIEVVSCDCGESGLEALLKGEFSLVVLDVMMPDISGYEVARRIRDEWGEEAPPVALFSARPPEAIRKEVGDLEIAGILQKPFQPDELAESVARLIKNSNEG